jgi:hypothetical protein
VTTAPGPSTGTRLFWWLVGSVLVGWFVVYNLMRIGGASPEEAAWPALAIGGIAALVIYGILLLVARALRARGVQVGRRAVEVPGPADLTPPQRRATRLAFPLLGALAAVALVMGVLLLLDWLAEDPDTRALTTLVLAGWNILAGLWLGDEAVRLRGNLVDGAESAVLGCALTAVLGGVGVARDVFETGQFVLIVLAGLAGAAVGVVVWRIGGGRGIPLGAVAVVAVAVLAIVLPLA